MFPGLTTLRSHIWRQHAAIRFHSLGSWDSYTVSLMLSLLIGLFRGSDPTSILTRRDNWDISKVAPSGDAISNELTGSSYHQTGCTGDKFAPPLDNTYLASRRPVMLVERCTDIWSFVLVNNWSFCLDWPLMFYWAVKPSHHRQWPCLGRAENWSVDHHEEKHRRELISLWITDWRYLMREDGWWLKACLGHDRLQVIQLTDFCMVSNNLLSAQRITR